MTDPTRLLDSSSNEALRSLLGSGLDDAPGPEALPKVAAALGVASVAVGASSLAAASAHAASAQGTALAGSTSATVAGHAASSAGLAGLLGGNTVAALSKTLLVSMVSAGTLSAGALAVHEYGRSSPPSVDRAERTVEASPAGETRRAQPQRAERAPDESGATIAKGPAATTTLVPREIADARPAPGAVGLRSSPEPLAGPEGVSPPSVPDQARAPQAAGPLAREVRQIDSARQALESRNADGALSELDDYERSRVVGVLDREALLLKIEALSQKQDLEQAKVLARQYLARFPSDAHAPRLRALLGTTSSSVQTFPRE